MLALFFVGLVLYLWEEGRSPGGVVEIMRHLHFAARSRQLGEIVTASYVLAIAFVPTILPTCAVPGTAAMMLGIMEAVTHVALIRMFRLKHFYSPGLAAALTLLQPMSLCTCVYAIRRDVMEPASWLLAHRRTADCHQESVT
jgi:hypothetical protein